ncbi:MAG: hypothetical protein JW883_05250 [Deltaproteobacteria bacterium]|nr:hypothetical protein [Deltaproteobacteria bacterium]
MEQYIIEAADRLQVPPITLEAFTEEQIAIVEGVLKDFKSPNPKHKAMLEAMFCKNKQASEAQSNDISSGT